MRLLTKAEACRELGLSLSTLDRRIAAGELQARREPHGRRHRVYVILDDEPPESEIDESGGVALAVSQERIRGLEEQVALLQGQMDRERQRNGELVDQLRDAATATGGMQQRPWWLGWRRLSWPPDTPRSRNC